MSAQEHLLGALKKDVRSLLISAKTGLTPQQLQKDYMTMMGHRLPLHTLGYRSVMDMVQDLPDVVQVQCAGDGSVLLKAIGDESTRGMEELVSKQRSNKRRSAINSQRSAPIHSMLPLHRRRHVPPSLPAPLRSELKKLLSSSPVLLCQLERSFSQRFGRPLQIHHYGFYSVAELLSAAGDMITVQQTRAGSLLVLKRQDYPARSRALQCSTGHVKKSPNKVIQHVFESALLSDDVKKPSPSNLVKQIPQSNCLKHPQAPPKKEETITVKKQLSPEEIEFEKCIKKLEEELKTKILDSGPAGTVSPELKEKIRQVVSQKPEGLLVKNLPEEFKKLFKEDLPVNQSGFLSVTDLVSALSDTLYVDQGEADVNTNWIVFDAQQKQAQQRKKDLSETQAPELSQPLNPSDRSYFFHCDVSKWESGDLEEEQANKLQYDSELKVVTEKFQQSLEMYEPILSQLEARLEVPPDAIQNERLQLVAEKKEKAFVSVLVESVISPSQFYIRFCGTEEAKVLENIMIEMRGCYSFSEVSERYRLPAIYIRAGQVCCVSPGGIWFYRVIIHRVVNETEVEVYYVDFGNLGFVEKSSLKFLKSCYSKLPAQAVPSILTWIKPFKGVWSEKAVSQFQKLCCAKPMVAVIHKYVEGILHLFLCDTYTDADIYIHCVLQIQGYAVPCSISDIGQPFGEFNPVALYLKWQTDLPNPVTEEEKTKKQAPLSGRDADRMLYLEPTPVRADCWEREMDFSDLPELEFEGNLEDSLQEQPAERSNPFSALLQSESVPTTVWDEDWGQRSPMKTKTASCREALWAQSRDLRAPSPQQTVPVLNKPDSFPDPQDERYMTLSHCQPVAEGTAASPACLVPEEAPQVCVQAGELENKGELSSTPDLQVKRDSVPLAVQTQRLARLLFPLSRNTFCVPQTSASSVLGPAARLATATQLVEWFSYKKV
ncbi:tudor domain-containing protein 5 [Polyodon spathula]|uniref:tudor domain-containing protein 5 n=1 Tax=Polyodon spathula TaxID=7913 RepID=UPI001B7F6C5E|nr:tudor domain-containing protein 5 [Polyodon spathula]